MNNEIISLHSHPEWRIPAARWFQEKWGIPLEEYLTSIDECIEGMAAKGIGTLYLVTEHTSFYERYGWEYLCMVQGDDGEQMRVLSRSIQAATSGQVGIISHDAHL